MSTKKRQIAVLGGGVSSMVAAFELTDYEGWRDLYDVTVYQMGWRLGGKGASGRNPDVYERIEEHGLHVWMGHYENAFRMMRATYEELGRPAGAPLARWDEAFKKHSNISILRRTRESWRNWVFDFPVNTDVPGDGGELPSVFAYIEMGLQVLLRLLTGRLFYKEHSLTGRLFDGLERVTRAVLGAVDAPDWIVDLFDGLGVAIDNVVDNAAFAALGLAYDLAKTLNGADGVDETTAHEHHSALLWLLEQFLKELLEEIGELLGIEEELLELYTIMELGVVLVRGLLADDVVSKGFDSIDEYDFREWLLRHGASDLVVYQTPPVKGMYSLLFAYVGGDPNDSRLAAGVAIRFLLRMGLAYKGAIFWKMEAGMGDVVFAPLYEVLKRRGVRFEFFHKVEQLEINPLFKTVERIQLTRQVELVNGDEYDPLYPVKGLPCWPDRPRYDQIVDGEELQASEINLESYWAKPWKGATPRTLQKGVDFDDVVLGISIGALPHLCPQIIADDPRWAAMIEHIKTNQTQALQLWLKPTLRELGWRGAPTVMTNYAEPQNTYADMHQVLDRELWPPGAVQDIAYFCGPMLDAEEIPPFSDHGFPAREAARVKRWAIQWLRDNTGWLWRDATEYDPTGLDWSLLEDPKDRAGVARLNAQFWRANIDPTERYVLSVPGSTRFRLAAHESGYKNLYLTGDWIRTGLNCGCVEAATMAGMQAAQAITGRPSTIVGERDF